MPREYEIPVESSNIDGSIFGFLEVILECIITDAIYDRTDYTAGVKSDLLKKRFQPACRALTVGVKKCENWSSCF